MISRELARIILGKRGRDSTGKSRTPAKARKPLEPADIEERWAEIDKMSFDGLKEGIYADIRRRLWKADFFALLPYVMLPTLESLPHEHCWGDCRKAVAVLKRMGFGPEMIPIILAALEDRGGFCDCEILYNVATKEDDEQAGSPAPAPTPRPAANGREPEGEGR